jgi:AcrR family transcriptional regulator
MNHRQRQALATQTLITDAGRMLFLEQGYGATTIEAIAAEAGVAVSTVYAIFKNKRGILRAIREDWHQASQQREVYRAALDEADPAQRLARVAHATRRQWESGGTMVAIYRSASSVDPEAADELKVALQGRRTFLDQFIQSSASLLHPSLTVERAAARVRALTRHEVYQELVIESGWSADEYEHWLAQTLQQQLLDSP